MGARPHDGVVDWPSGLRCTLINECWRKMGLMARALTAKQLGFARLVAEGMSKTEALLRAYATGRRSRATARVEACRLSKDPRVAAEIQRLVCDRFPETVDFSTLWQRSIAVLQQLSECGPDSIRLKSALALLEVADAASVLRSQPSSREAKHALGKLREVYRKAQIMEDRYSTELADATPGETATQERATPADCLETEGCSMPGSATHPRTPICQEDICDVTRTEESCRRPGRLSADSTNAEEIVPSPADIRDSKVNLQDASEEHQIRYEWRSEPIPGRFPPRYRRIWTRVQ
jgi:phage terminase small subunit